MEKSHRQRVMPWLLAMSVAAFVIAALAARRLFHAEGEALLSAYVLVGSQLMLGITNALAFYFLLREEKRLSRETPPPK